MKTRQSKRRAPLFRHACHWYLAGGGRDRFDSIILINLFYFIYLLNNAFDPQMLGALLLETHSLRFTDLVKSLWQRVHPLPLSHLPFPLFFPLLPFRSSASRLVCFHVVLPLQLKMRFLGSERGRQSSPVPHQPKDRSPQHHSSRDATINTTTTAPTTPARHGTTEWGGRSRCSNTENEGPAAAAATATPIPGSVDGCGSQHAAFSHQPAETSATQSSSSSSWRQLKKLDHHHHHNPRQISPSLVASLPAVVVESGPPVADGGGGGHHPHKRMRKSSTEEDLDGGNIGGGGGGKGSYYAHNGSPLLVPGSEAGSRRPSASLSPPPSLPRLGFYLGSPLADSASSSAAAAAVSATATTAGNKCSFSSDSDYNQAPYAASHDWELEQPRAVGGGGGGGGGRGDEDAAAAAVRVLGLRNGHTSAAAAAVAATQPAATLGVGSKRAREAVEQAHVSMPAAVKIVHNPSTASHSSGGGDVGGRRPSTGTRQRVDKR